MYSYRSSVSFTETSLETILFEQSVVNLKSLECQKDRIQRGKSDISHISQIVEVVVMSIVNNRIRTLLRVIQQTRESFRIALNIANLERLQNNLFTYWTTTNQADELNVLLFLAFTTMQARIAL